MIYTKKGDKGTTTLFEPNPTKRTRIPKNSQVFVAIGSVDELNSYLGIANLHTKNKKTKQNISEVQRKLFTIGAILAKSKLEFKKSETSLLEKEIDKLDENLPPLRNFLLPEGSESAVAFMYARSVCRRAERNIVALSKKQKVAPEILQYLNRLSDYLFVIFRDENRLAKVKEELWVGRKS